MARLCGRITVYLADSQAENCPPGSFAFPGRSGTVNCGGHVHESHKQFWQTAMIFNPLTTLYDDPSFDGNSGD